MIFYTTTPRSEDHGEEGHVERTNNNNIERAAFSNSIERKSERPVPVRRVFSNMIFPRAVPSRELVTRIHMIGVVVVHTSHHPTTGLF